MTFNNLYMTTQRFSLISPTYFELISSKLLTDTGLNIGYYDYFNVVGTKVTKSSSVSMNVNYNSSSLDQAILTFRHGDFTSRKGLCLATSMELADASCKSFYQVLADPTITNTEVTSVNTVNNGFGGDAFNQSYYFKRNGNDLRELKWQINNQDMTAVALTPNTIWQETLCALGNHHLDSSCAGVHPGCLSIYHFLLYYFTSILSLENLSGDGSVWKSGLSGLGSSINIAFTATFESLNAETVIPNLFLRSTKQLNIQQGKLLSVF
jgi:hypothetical protein